MDNKQQEIRFNIVDIVKAIDTSVKESNQLSKIIKSSKLDGNIVNSINDYFKNINFITSSITKVFQSISDTENIKPVNPIKLLWNLELSVVNLNLIIKQIPKVLKGIDTDTMKELISNISPSKTDVKKTKKEGEITTIEQTSIDKMTPFELIKCVFDLLNSLNDVKLINPVKVYLSLKLLDTTLKITNNNFQKILGTLSIIGKQRKNIIEKSKDAVDAFKAVFGNIKTIIDDIFYIAKWSILAVLAMAPVLLFTSMLSSFIKTILFLTTIKNIKDNEKSINIFKSIINIIKNIVLIALVLIPMTPIFILSSAALIVSTIFILSLISFVYVVKLLTGLLNSKIVISINKKINRIESITKNLLNIALNITLLAIVSVIAIPALVIDVVFVLALTGFVLILKVLLKIAKIKFKSILSLILIIAVLGLLILIAIEIKKLNDIGSKIKWVNLFMILGGILLVAVFSILIGLAAMAIIPIIGIAAIGLVALIIVVGLLVLIAFALEYLQSIELNQDAIIRNVMAILDCAEKIKELLFKSKENKEPQTDSSSQESKDALKDMGVADPGIIEVLAKFGSLFTTLLSVALISFIAGKLNDLQQLTLNRDAIMTNVGVVLDVSKNITNVLFDKPVNTGEGEGSEDNKSMIESLINFIGGPFKMLSGLLEAIVAVPILLTTILSVGMIYVIAKMLTKIVEIELDGVAIRKKINDIVFTAQSISDMVFGNYEETPKQPSTEEKSKWTQFIDGAKEVGGKVWNATGGALLDAAGNLISGGVLGSLMPSLMSLNVVVDLIKGVQELEFDSTSTTNKINEIIRITKTISSSVSSGTGSIASIDEDKVEIFEDYVDSSIKYFKNINKLDVDKIKSIGDMYDKMGQFMEKLNNAPINDIADALVNKISPALSSIDESIGGNKNNKKSNNSTIVTTQATDQSAQTSKQIDYTSMLENIEDLLEQIKKKLNSQPQPAF